MSLINDALKRASHSDRNRPAQAAVPLPMQPVAKPPRARISLPVAAIIVAALGLAVAGWYLWKGWEETPPIMATTPAQPAQTAAAKPPPAPPSSLTVVPTAPAPAPVPAPEAWPTDLTVKAIFYSKTNPRALINGKTVETGDKIDGVLVTGILSDRVFLDWKGQTREIRMSGP